MTPSREAGGRAGGADRDDSAGSGGGRAAARAGTRGIALQRAKARGFWRCMRGLSAGCARAPSGWRTGFRWRR